MIDYNASHTLNSKGTNREPVSLAAITTPLVQNEATNTIEVVVHDLNINPNIDRSM